MSVRSRRRPGPIHYVCQVFPKLTETFVVDEILALEAAGERVIIDSVEPVRDEPRHPALARLRAPVRYVPEEPEGWRIWMAHLSLALRRPRTWFRTARKARADGTWKEFHAAGLVARRTLATRARHLHTHFAYWCADVAGMAAALAGRPFALTVHANDIWQVTNAPHLARRLSLAAAVITPTEYNARHLRQAAPGVPVHVIPYGVAPAELVAPPATGPVLCVARLVPKKGVDTLVEAFARLAPGHDGLRLELIGEGHLDPVRALADRLGVADRVDFRGAQPPDAVRDAYRRCSVFALPCRIADDGDRDGLPVVLLEALAHGLPVVTTDVIGIPEAVHDRVNGLLVPPDDPAALAAAIAELVFDRGLAGRLGESGRSLVREKLSRESRTRALLDVFASA